jgi:hypothetical protein
MEPFVPGLVQPFSDLRRGIPTPGVELIGRLRVEGMERVPFRDRINTILSFFGRFWRTLYES